MGQEYMPNSTDIVQPIVAAISGNNTIQYIGLGLSVMLVCFEVLKIVLQHRRHQNQIRLSTAQNEPYHGDRTPSIQNPETKLVPSRLLLAEHNRIVNMLADAEDQWSQPDRRAGPDFCNSNDTLASKEFGQDVAKSSWSEAESGQFARSNASDTTQVRSSKEFGATKCPQCLEKSSRATSFSGTTSETL
ncbi:hypothetical protein H2198_009401 [Neophaeococcomyces mojaviensis]|uniref:Uncharacterized protein n=1 Tax=Neophaeococcomyces mojaviensis TaxID=3383035 RepID=A0ACC2ZUV5_9EURO|nr:hypothetical protein H2198_009401 [Knufia sp. JES_112]